MTECMIDVGGGTSVAEAESDSTFPGCEILDIKTIKTKHKYRYHQCPSGDQ
jgi:hypothetical protein